MLASQRYRDGGLSIVDFGCKVAVLTTLYMIRKREWIPRVAGVLGGHRILVVSGVERSRVTGFAEW